MALGEAHPDFAASLNNLAALYQAMGSYTQAEPLYRQAMEIRCVALGEAHPDFAASLNNLAMLYQLMGNYAQAEPLYRLALSARGAALGVDFAHTWSCYKGGALHCGRCGTCVERREAFLVAGLPDPTVYADTGPLPLKPPTA